MIVDADMDIFPSRGGSIVTLIGLFMPVAGDAMAYVIEPAQLFDIEVDHIPWGWVLVAPLRFRRVEIFKAGQASSFEDTADGRWRHSNLLRNMRPA